MPRLKNGSQPCAACAPPEFERNNYFCGKLMVERDFWADQEYHIGKQRLHARYLHGWGTVCGLRVEPHPRCPDRRLVVTPGLAVDCCGRDILLKDRVEIELKPLLEELPPPDDDGVARTLYLCLRYEECYVEPISALFSSCGCSDDRCEPNRIRDGFRFALLTSAPPAPPVPDEPCDDVFDEALADCPACDDDAHCVVLAKLSDYLAGEDVTEDMIDNAPAERRFLYSTELLSRALRCLMDRSSGGATGPRGPAGQSVTAVNVTYVAPPNPGTASYDPATGVLTLEIPKGADGADGVGREGPQGPPGVGLDPALTHVSGINWPHGGQTTLARLESDGLVVAFDTGVIFGTVNRHTFWVLADRDNGDGTWSYAHVPGDIRAVTVQLRRCLVGASKDLPTPRPDDLVDAVRFVFDPKWMLALQQPIARSRVDHFRIVLKGDFILDGQKRPIDPEYMHRMLPDGRPLTGLGPQTPNGPCTSGDWVPGGDFESWIEVAR